MLNNQLEKNEKNNMITVYQLSRQQCAPCQVLKSKIENLENKSFTYKYIDIDTQLFPWIYTRTNIKTIWKTIFKITTYCRYYKIRR